MHAEIGNMDREMHIDGPSNDVDLEAFRGITDTYASIPDEWKSDLFLIWRKVYVRMKGDYKAWAEHAKVRSMKTVQRLLSPENTCKEAF